VSKAGSFELISLTPGALPGGSDISPGSSLSGFLFHSWKIPGTMVPGASKYLFLEY
jgi:hypothetical protein